MSYILENTFAESGAIDLLRDQFDLSIAQVNVLCALLRIDGTSGCHPTQETIVKAARVKLRTAQHALAALREKGLIHWTKAPYRDKRGRSRPGKINHYQFLNPVTTAPDRVQQQEIDPDHTWKAVKLEFISMMPDSHFAKWIRDTRGIAYDGVKFTVEAPFIYDPAWLTNEVGFQLGQAFNSLGLEIPQIPVVGPTGQALKRKPRNRAGHALDFRNGCVNEVEGCGHVPPAIAGDTRNDSGPIYAIIAGEKSKKEVQKEVQEKGTSSPRIFSWKNPREGLRRNGNAPPVSQAEIDPAHIWEDAKQEFLSKMPGSHCTAWIRDTRGSAYDGVEFTIEAQSLFDPTWITGEVASAIVSALFSALKPGAKLPVLRYVDQTGQALTLAPPPPQIQLQEEGDPPTSAPAKLCMCGQEIPPDKADKRDKCIACYCADIRAQKAEEQANADTAQAEWLKKQRERNR